MHRVTLIAIVLAGLLLIAGSGFAQILNPGFESWSAGNPANWETTNGLYTFVTQATPGHSGSYAVQGSVVNMGAITMPAVISAGSDGKGFAISQRYAALHGFYKFTPVNGDGFMVSVLMDLGTSGVGAGSFLELSPQVNFREFVAPIIYPGSDVPDKIEITLSMMNPGGLTSVGSIFVVDDISLSTTTGVNDLANGLPKGFRLEQNYPNPFNPTTSIVYDVPSQSHVRLTVLDVLGREVAQLVNGTIAPGRYKAVFDAHGLSSGVYVCRLQAGSFTAFTKMMLVR